jgi:CBS domain-containing protein
MKIERLYSPDLNSCVQDDRLTDVAVRMRQAEISALAVIDDRAELVGIISERDLARAMADGVDPDMVEVSAYASEGVAVATPDEDSAEVAERMIEAGIRHMPVVSDGRLVGMVSMRDLLAVHTRA